MRRFRKKTDSVGAEVTSADRLFQRRLPAIINARSPTVDLDSRVRRITSCEDDDDRTRRRLESATRWMCSRKDTEAPLVRPCRIEGLVDIGDAVCSPCLVIVIFITNLHKCDLIPGSHA